jgi:hypothetical protein
LLCAAREGKVAEILLPAGNLFHPCVLSFDLSVIIFFIAADAGKSSLIKHLLTLNINNSEAILGHALCLAVKYNKLETTNILLDAGANIKYQYYSFGETTSVLRQAIDNDNIEMFVLLVERMVARAETNNDVKSIFLIIRKNIYIDKPHFEAVIEQLEVASQDRSQLWNVEEESVEVKRLRHCP